MLVIEVDGDSHSSQIDYDTERTAYLQTQGYRVIRFSNTDIMGNIEGVLSVVQTMIATPPLPSLSPEGERV
ncbi:MAG: endonuclease domain-containing protein [Sphingobium sp.]|nr:endonuclease domain-containing protein [Sphingobium sp.]